MAISYLNEDDDRNLDRNLNGENITNKVGGYYQSREIDWKAPKPVTHKGTTYTSGIEGRKAPVSIFNRYSIFFLNQNNNSNRHDDYFDDPQNRKEEIIGKVRRDPTASNIIEWSKSGNTNAVEYAWEDFLWCKNYGVVPNNYMVTLRRFGIPPLDDLFNANKNPVPDLGRMITWVDGETNKWDTVGLKWSHNMVWKALESSIQDIQAQPGYGNESGAFGGGFGKAFQSFASLSDDQASAAKRSHNENSQSINPYQNANVVYGPIDVITKTHIRDRGLEFDQQITLVFEYQLRSIDNVNPRVAMIDLLSNILLVTMNRGDFWGGDIVYYGNNPRRVKPFGDPDKLAKGDMEGYLKSFIGGLSQRMNNLTGGKGLSFEGVVSAAKNLGGNLLNQIVGGGLDKMGRPGLQALNSLLSGEPTGFWHVTIGNPSNPIIQSGNMILEKTEVELGGPLGYDDFPTSIKVTCTLKPAMPRDRTNIINMFSRSGRAYLTTPPEEAKYLGNASTSNNSKGKPIPNAGRNQNNSNQKKKNSKGRSVLDAYNPNNWQMIKNESIRNRFPNHIKGPNGNSKINDNAQQIY